MVWYDSLYSTVCIPDVLKALDKLSGVGTINQIERQIIRMYRLPRGMINNKEIIIEPLERLIDLDFVTPVPYKRTIKYKLRPDWREILFS